MFVKTVPEQSGDRSLIQVGAQAPLNLVVSRARITSGGAVVYGNRDEDELTARYDDVCDALADKSVVIYDCTQAVGYWKPKHRTPRKATAKAATDGK